MEFELFKRRARCCLMSKMFQVKGIYCKIKPKNLLVYLISSSNENATREIISIFPICSGGYEGPLMLCLCLPFPL